MNNNVAFIEQKGTRRERERNGMCNFVSFGVDESRIAKEELASSCGDPRRWFPVNNQRYAITNCHYTNLTRSVPTTECFKNFLSS
jgi:hypothetical protein